MLQCSDMPIIIRYSWHIIPQGTADDHLNKKIPKQLWLFAAILLFIIGFFNYRYNTAKEQTDNLKELYQVKNNRGFLTLLRQGHSYIPLAETIEKISKVSDQEDPAKVQKLIELAKTRSKEADQYLATLIEFSDSYVSDSDPRFMANHTVMTSKNQEDMFMLALQADIFMTMYEVSYNYWKDQPKLIPQDTKRMLVSIANELRSLDETLQSFKDRAVYNMEWGDFASTEQIKDFTLREIKPHLEKLVEIKSKFRE